MYFTLGSAHILTQNHCSMTVTMNIDACNDLTQLITNFAITDRKCINMNSPGIYLAVVLMCHLTYP